MNTRSWIAAVVVLAASPAFADTPPDFSGEWVANDGRSADANTAPPSASPSHSGGHDMHGGGMGGGGMHGGMGGGGMHGGHGHRNPAGGAVPTGNAKANANPRRDAHTLVIRQSEVVFDIDADGQRMVYRFDNRRSNGTPEGSAVKLNWTSPNMTIDTKLQAGADIAERYALSPDGNRLTLTMHVQKLGEDAVQEIDRVFVRAGEGDEPPAKGDSLPPP